MFLIVNRTYAKRKAMAEKRVENAAVAAAQKLGFKEIKPAQLEVITATAEGYDVFAVLPTGCGKTIEIRRLFLLSSLLHKNFSK